MAHRLFVLLLCLGACVTESRVTKDTLLGANIDFDYLGDDDDDDSTGGAPPSTFEAFISDDTGDESIPYGDTVTFSVAPAASDAQTSGQVVAQVIYAYGDFVDSFYDVAPTTTFLNGWSESGWTRTSWGHYYNVFTKASVSGSYTIQFTVPVMRRGDETSGGTLRGNTTYLAAPHTAEATGLGNEVTITVTAPGGG